MLGRISCLIVAGALNVTVLQPFCIDKDDQAACSRSIKADERLDIANIFRKMDDAPLAGEVLVSSPLDLQIAAQDALSYINRYKKTHLPIIAPHKITAEFFPLHSVIKTLEFIDETIEQDKAKGKFRIQDPAFVADNFEFFDWQPDVAGARRSSCREVTRDEINLTSYVVYCFKGSPVKTKKYSYPLMRDKSQKSNIPLTKQEILAGALTKNPAYAKRCVPLVWLTRAGLEEALLQGTILVEMPDGGTRAFKIHTNNGFKYEKGLRKTEDQKIYWFFKELAGKNVVRNLKTRCRQRAGVIFAGDVYNIGLGKVVGIRYVNKKTGQPCMRLGVIGDTGGAFVRNLYQLDLFGGIKSSRDETKAYLQNFPSTVKAYLVCKK